jgi:predicted GIY-YIG superfamily endonuclease
MATEGRRASSFSPNLLRASVDAVHFNKSAMWVVYTLQCADGTYYTGCTNDLEDRLNRHNIGQIHYTKTRLPVTLHTYIAFFDKYKAFDYEKYLKSESGIAFRKKRLI